MAEYRVVPGSLSVAPVKSSYAQNEPVRLHIKCTVERKNGLGSLGNWVSDYLVYKKDKTLLASDGRQHSMAPWTAIDQAKDDFEIEIGEFTQGSLLGYVLVRAHG